MSEKALAERLTQALHDQNNVRDDMRRAAARLQAIAASLTYNESEREASIKHSLYEITAMLGGVSYSAAAHPSPAPQAAEPARPDRNARALAYERWCRTRDTEDDRGPPDEFDVAAAFNAGCDFAGGKPAPQVAVEALSDAQVRRLYENSPELHHDVKTLAGFRRVVRVVLAAAAGGTHEQG